MKVQVLFNFDNVESVDPSNLKRLIADNKIQAFRRSSGWVRIGVDPIRGDGGKEYDGPERRNVVQKSLTESQKRGLMRCILGVRGKW
jgi:hypothetical protein